MPFDEVRRMDDSGKVRADDPPGVMGMLARRKKELEDAMRAASGTGGGPGGGAPADDSDSYLDISGRRWRKGQIR